jgi:S-DNA-T family DNA segregation ATPase FtsK/SpoIIIE
LFHTLARQFADWLVADSKAAAGRPEDGTELWKAMYDQFAAERLDELIRQGLLPSAHHLSSALESFCRRLSDLRKTAGADFRSWRDLFLTQEYELKMVEVSTSRGRIFVSGRPDAVRNNFGSGIEVVDYKLSRGLSLKEDLIQVAAYAHLLGRRKPGLRFSGIVEYYEPALHVTPVTAEELEGIWKDVIEPVLEEIVSFGEGGAAGNQTRGPAGLESREMADRIEKTYAGFQLEVRVIGQTEAPQLVRYEVKPGEGVKVVSLANRAEDLQVALGLRSAPLVRAAAGCVTIDLPKEKPDPVFLRDVEMPAGSGSMRFPLGVGVNGEVVTADFSDPNMCHLLVAGAAGSGKSEFLKSLVASLIRGNTPERLELFLIDPKAVTFAPLANCRHLAGPIMTDLPSTLKFLEEAVADMDSRYIRLSEQGFDSLGRRGADKAMPYRVIVFDEFADLILGGRKERQHFEDLVARLAQKGRAAGVHVVLATQRPDRNVVTGLIKGNLPLKVCLRVTSAVNSQIILGSPGAETLLGRGDLLCDRGRGLERVQSPFATAEDFSALCQ